MRTLLDFERELLDLFQQMLNESPDEKFPSGRTHEEFIHKITGDVPVKRLRNIILNPDGFNIQTGEELDAVCRFYSQCALMLPTNDEDFMALAAIACVSYSLNE